MLVLVSRLGIAAEESHHVAHGQFTGGCLALERHVGELALAVLQVNDSLFYCALDDELVYFDVDCLVEAVDSVDGLLFHELD